MRLRVLNVTFTVVVLSCICFSQDRGSKAAASGPASFVGRWEIQFKEPNGGTRPIAILEISAQGANLSGKLVATQPPNLPATVKQLSVKGAELLFVFEIGVQIQFKGKRVGDRLEGSASDGTMNVSWVGIATTRDKVEEPDDREAFNAATRVRDPQARTGRTAESSRRTTPRADSETLPIVRSWTRTSRRNRSMRPGFER